MSKQAPEWTLDIYMGMFVCVEIKNNNRKKQNWDEYLMEYKKIGGEAKMRRKRMEKSISRGRGEKDSL